MMSDLVDKEGVTAREPEHILDIELRTDQFDYTFRLRGVSLILSSESVGMAPITTPQWVLGLRVRNIGYSVRLSGRSMGK